MRFPASCARRRAPGPGITPDGVACVCEPAAKPQVPAVDTRTQGLGGQSIGSALALPSASSSGISRSMLLAALLPTVVGTQLSRCRALKCTKKTT
jgi:hypothetical protein